MLQHAGVQANGELADCPAGEGFTPLVTETAGAMFGNAAARIVTRLLCNRCGAVLEAPAADHPTQRPGFRG